MTCYACKLKELPEPKEATLLPVLLLFAPPKLFPDAPPARSVCGLPVCEEHKADITIDYLLTDKGFEQIAHTFHLLGKMAPERAATKLEFIDINSEEARSFIAGSKRRAN
jgi:hypothetical protein